MPTRAIMTEASYHVVHSLPENCSRGKRVRNGQAGLMPVESFRRTLGIAGYASFLAVAIAGISGPYVDGAMELTVLRRFAEQPAFDAARYRYAAVRSPESDVPIRVSPDVAVLIEQHRAALAALTVAVPEAICR